MIYLFLSAMLVLVMLLQFAETKTQKVSMRLNVTAWILSFLLGIAIYLSISGREIMNLKAKDIFLLSEAVSINYFLATWLLVWIWQWKVFQRKTWYVLFYLVFPVCQFFAFWCVLLDLQHTGELHILYMLGLVSGAVSSWILFRVIFEQSRKTEIEKKLRETKYMAELERAHFSHIEKERQELDNIKKQFQDQLQEVEAMIQMGEPDRAEEMLDSLENRIAATREYPYCSVPVINAVLTEKEKECEAQKIRLDADLKIAGNLKIDSIYLCSIFANLLDNAIHACAELSEEKRQILLKAAVQGDYLLIQSENPYVKKQQMKREKGHGYGIKIIREIAERFQGEYFTEEKDGNYKATVTLLVQKDGE